MYTFPRGEKAFHWKSGRKNNNGYVMVFSPKHPHRDSQGYVREHRLVMELKLGRYLEKGEVVHHINGNKSDNRIENLELLEKKDHDRLERYQRKSFDRTGAIPWNKGTKGLMPIPWNKGKKWKRKVNR